VPAAASVLVFCRCASVGRSFGGGLQSTQSFSPEVLEKLPELGQLVEARQVQALRPPYPDRDEVGVQEDLQLL